MKTFPSCWVLPGGHVDFGEFFHIACLRELREETGLDIRRNDNTYEYYLQEDPTVRVETKPFYLYESVTKNINDDPEQDSEKQPRSAHLVFFYKLKVHCPHSQLKMSMCDKEVEEMGWISPYELWETIVKNKWCLLKTFSG